MTQLLYIIFFLSGAAALIFETIWFRLAGLMLGNSVWSATLILGGFMGGLALGNGLISRYGDRLKRPVRFYAVLEFGIGATGMILVLVLPHLQSWLVPILQPFLDQPVPLNLIRFGIAFLLIIIPTTAMGATLPVLVKSLYRFNPHFGSVLGGLYGLNTIGAVFGALAGELVLINVFGIARSGLIAALMNMLAAFLSLKVSSVVDHQTEKTLPDTEASGQKGALSLDVVRLLICAFFAGAVLLALEVVWFRFLILFYRGTSFAFAVMLSIVLAGIGTGGLVGSQLFRRRISLHNHTRSIAVSGGLSLVITYLLFAKVFYAVQPAGGGSFTISLILCSLFLMFPVSFASGMLFTSIGHSLKEEVPSETRAAGLLTLANTIGALLGAFTGAFLLLPGMGMEKSLFAMALVYGGIACLIPSRPAVAGRRSRALSLVVLTAYLLSMVFFPFGQMEKDYFDIVDRRLTKKEERVDVREALTETIFYYRYDVMDEPFYYRLVTNGYSMSGTMVEAKRYMKLFVYLPAALKPDMKKALLISYGVGLTAKALTDTAQLEKIDVVDISRDIIEMSSIVYPEADENPLNDDRVSVYIEDGRFFLQSREERYDLITGEPPPPKLAGIVNLYSQEYFGLVRERLSEGGIASYWLPVHSLNEGDMKSIIKAFCTVFDDCSLWAGAGLDWMLLGTKNAYPPGSALLFARQWENPKTAAELIKLGIENPSQLGSLFMSGTAHLNKFVENTLPLTDNYPQRLSHALYASRKNPLYAAMMKEEDAMIRFQESAFVKKMWPEEIMKDTLRYFHFQKIIRGILIPQYRDPRSYVYDDLYRTLTTSSLETLPLWIMNTSRRELEIARLQHEGSERWEIAQLLFFVEALSERDYDRAVQIMEAVIGVGEPDKDVKRYPLYIFALCMSGQVEKADDVVSRIAPLLGSDAGMMKYWNWMNETFGISIPDSTMTNHQ